MNEVLAWSAKARAERAVAALKKHDFDALFAPTAEEAAKIVMGYISSGMKIGFGGSMTVRALGIQDKSEAAGAILLDHNKPGLSPEERMRIIRAQLSCDLFISSVNALTMDGKIVNVDANGNRVAALSFGPSKVVVVVGLNKLVRDEGEAFARLEEIAAPMNNKRLNRPNPCTVSGHCMDCDSTVRSCRIYQILRRKPALTDFTVIVVGEPLGY